MPKISEIYLKNFKFFPDDIAPLPVGAKHILLYGENGSGKSTIYWALYTLLEAANKPNVNQIAKYFDDRDAQNLLNIHSPTRATDAFIKIKLDDGTEWEISRSNTRINSNTEAQTSNFASDFINYRMLYRLLDFRNSEDIDLFSLFELDVFGYLDFTPGIQFPGKPARETNVKKIWEEIQKGPSKIPVPSSAVSEQYPISGPAHTDFIAAVQKFEVDMKNFINSLNPPANTILKDKLTLNADFELRFEVLSPYTITKVEYVPPKYRIALDLKSIGGVAIPATNKKPHIFLNEARLTAIGLSIRLAILEKRLATAPLKTLVLDDLLISLDMSNRTKVVNLVLNDYCSRYQVFILTHDNNFFELVKFRIIQEGQGNNWNFWEVYTNSEGPFEKPFFKFNQSSLAKAEAYFHTFDYPASGNYMRKAIEEFVDQWLPVWLKFDREYKPNDLAKKIALGTKYLKDSHIPVHLPNDLDLFRKFILNAASHAAHDTPIFKPELWQCIQTLKIDLPKFKYEKILDKNEAITIDFTDRTGRNIQIKITILEPAYLLKWDSAVSELSVFLGKTEETVAGVLNSPQYDQYNLKDFYSRCLIRSSPGMNPDFWKGFRVSGGNILESKRKF